MSWPRTRLRYVAELNPAAPGYVTSQPDLEASFVPMEAIGEDASLNLDQTRPVEAVRNGYSFFQNGDVVFAKVTPCFENGKAAVMWGLAEGIGFGTTEVTVARANSRIYNRFLFYVLTEDHFRKLGKSAMTGAGGLKRVPDLFTKDYSFPLPSLAEQRQVVDFLDRETAQIDDLIGKQERLLELLAEKRQAVITRAVTQGLDPTVPTKPSGIPWLEAIPTHWTEKPMCHFMTGRVDYRGATPQKTDQGVFLVTAKNVRKGYIDYSVSAEYIAHEDYEKVMSRGLPSTGDILMTMEAPLGNFALIDDPEVALAQRVVKFRPKHELLPEFAVYAMNSPYFQAQLEARATGSTALGLKASKLIELRLVAPSSTEQQRITDYLDASTGRIDALARRSETAVQLLLERRSALISAAVTGKINVQGKMAPSESGPK